MSLSTTTLTTTFTAKEAKDTNSLQAQLDFQHLLRLIRDGKLTDTNCLDQHKAHADRILWQAIYSQNKASFEKVFDWVLKHNHPTNVIYVDNQGNNALHYAAKWLDAKQLGLLVKFFGEHAKEMARSVNNKGLTPSDIVQKDVDNEHKSILIDEQNAKLAILKPLLESSASIMAYNAQLQKQQLPNDQTDYAMLQKALEIINITRKKIPICSNHPTFPKNHKRTEMARNRSMIYELLDIQQTFAAYSLQETLKDLLFLHCAVKIAEQNKIGHCYIYARYAFKLLQEENIPCRLVCTDKGDHDFVEMGKWIVDPWAGMIIENILPETSQKFKLHRFYSVNDGEEEFSDSSLINYNPDYHDDLKVILDSEKIKKLEEKEITPIFENILAICQGIGNGRIDRKYAKYFISFLPEFLNRYEESITEFCRKKEGETALSVLLKIEQETTLNKLWIELTAENVADENKKDAKLSELNQNSLFSTSTSAPQQEFKPNTAWTL